MMCQYPNTETLIHTKTWKQTIVTTNRSANYFLQLSLSIWGFSLGDLSGAKVEFPYHINIPKIESAVAQSPLFKYYLLSVTKYQEVQFYVIREKKVEKPCSWTSYLTHNLIVRFFFQFSPHIRPRLTESVLLKRWNQTVFKVPTDWCFNNCMNLLQATFKGTLKQQGLLQIDDLTEHHLASMKF